MRGWKGLWLAGMALFAAGLSPAAASGSAPSTKGPPRACGGWEIQPSPDPGHQSRNSSLSAVSALGPDDAWAVGSYEDESFHALSLAEHWDGAAWTVVKTPNGPANTLLYGAGTAPRGRPFPPACRGMEAS